MAITSYKLLKSGGAGNMAGQTASAKTRSYEAVFQLISDDPLDGPAVALDYFENTTGLPDLGDPYQFGNDQDPTAFCTRIAPSRVGNNIFNVGVSWEQPGGGGGGSEPEKVSIDLTRKPPLQWHDNIEISSTFISVPIRRATFKGYIPNTISNTWLPQPQPGVASYRGPVINSALDPYDPEPEGEVAIEILRITRNVYPWEDLTAAGFRNSVNQDLVQINKPDYGFSKTILPTCGRIIEISGSFEIDLEYKQKYWRHSIEVHIHPITWRLQMIDKGLRRRAKSGDTTDTGVTITASTVATDGPQLIHIKDPAGNPITTPILLDGNGKPSTSTTPVLMEWEFYKEMSWATIPW